MRPVLSVIIPVYNDESRIRDAVGSALVQTLDDLEVLVVDDGSTDRSLRAAEAIRDSRLRVIRSDHGGASRAINLGLKEARGDIVAYLASDDEWLPTAAETFVGALDSHPGASGVYGSFYELGPGSRGYVAAAPFDRTRLFRECYVNLSAFAWRGNGTRFDPRTDPCSDWDFLLRLLPRGDLLPVPRSVGIRNLHAGQLTSHRWRMLRGHLRVAARHRTDGFIPDILGYTGRYMAECLRSAIRD